MKMWDNCRIPVLVGVGILLLMLVVGCAAHPSPELAYWKCIYAEGWLECKSLEVVK